MWQRRSCSPPKAATSGWFCRRRSGSTCARRELLGDAKTTPLATEKELAGAYPMFELGAVPPFGGPAGDRTVVDRRLAEQESVLIEAGSDAR
jgi:hypothetical protein